MPLFSGLSNTFSMKKTPSRKSSKTFEEELQDLVSDQKQVHLNLGDHKFLFKNGEWLAETGYNGNMQRTNQRLKKKIQELQEENNLLRLKYSILLKMLTQSTAEGHLQEKELEKLRKL